MEERPSDLFINISSEAPSDSPRKNSVDSALSSRKSVTVTIPPPEITRTMMTPTADKPPKIPESTALSRRKSFTRSVYSKPKSRFGDQPVAIDSILPEDEETEPVAEGRALSSRGSPSSKRDDPPLTPKTPARSSFGGFKATDADEEEIFKKVSSRKKLKYRKVKAKVLFEWLLFLLILASLIASSSSSKLRDSTIWGLPLWKWTLLILVTFSGKLVTRWLIHFVVLLIELNFMLRKKVLYFAYGLKKSVQFFIWLSLVLGTWILLFNVDGVKESSVASHVLDFISWSIVSLLIGSFLWLLKTLFLKILASTFHVNTFFERIQVAVFYQYILLTLSGPPMMVMDSGRMLGKTVSNSSRMSFPIGKKSDKEGKKKQEIDVSKLQMMKQEKVSAWTMKMLVDIVSNSGLTTLSSTFAESFYEEGNEEAGDKEITNEEEAIAAAYDIFRNVAQPCSTYLDENDLKRFMIKEEVEFVFQMIDVTDSRKIDRKSLTEWVVRVYKERKALAHALNDTKTAVKQLNKLISVILIVIDVVVWLLLTGIATTKVLVFLSSQLVLAAFMFGNTCKTIFEALIFVFVMHPFDVGDRCVVDGVQMVVEEMNILTTVFLRFDNEKIYYPNSILATKPISNFYRSPEMGDSVDFSISFKTPLERIGILRERIKRYLERNPQHWHPNHNLVVKDIEDANKIKMCLFVNHTINFQEIGEKSRRRSDLVLEVKKIFEELGIVYELLPQQVHLINPHHHP